MTVATDPRKTGVNAGMSLLAASTVKVDLTGTLVETALATISIPAGSMGTNGGLLIYTAWTITNSANNKILRVRFGGIGGAQYLTQTLTATLSYHDMRRIRNRNSASAQIGGSSATTGGGLNTSGGVVVTSSVDTTTAQDLVLTGQLALNTETISLENYEVWLLP